MNRAADLKGYAKVCFWEVIDQQSFDGELAVERMREGEANVQVHHCLLGD